MTTTYSTIATATGTGSSGTITFSSIPSTYTDLVLVLFGSASTSTDTLIRVGSGSLDTASNYTYTILRGNGTLVNSIQGSGTSIQATSYAYPTTSIGYLSTLNFMSYSNTTTQKDILIRAGVASGTGGSDSIIGVWKSTSAIDIISIFKGSGNWTTDFTASLYGIKAE